MSWYAMRLQKHSSYNLDAIPVLKEFLHDEHIEVSESCEVALDLLDWVQTVHTRMTKSCTTF